MGYKKKPLQMVESRLKIDLKQEFEIDKRLEKIWSDYYIDQNPISPLYQKDVLKGAITFLSLNPSLQPKDKVNAKKGYYPAIPYPLIDSTKQNADYRFFQKFYDFGQDIKPWTIIDLLYIRESSQNQLKEKFDTKIVNDHDKTFLINQMKLTFKIIESISPVMVIVSNALSDRLIHRYLKELDLRQELPVKENGEIYRLNGIPFITNESRFLGSRFLQHNTDRRNRLIFEIKRIINNSNL